MVYSEQMAMSVLYSNTSLKKGTPPVFEAHYCELMLKAVSFSELLCMYIAVSYSGQNVYVWL